MEVKLKPLSFLVFVVLHLLAHKTNSYVIKMDQSVDVSAKDVCDIKSDNARFDCAPGPHADQNECESRGCCWRAVKTKSDMKSSNNIEESNEIKIDNNVGLDINVPYCYFPSTYGNYEVTEMKKASYGYQATLTRKTKSAWPDDVMTLQLDVYLYQTYLRFKLTDPSKKRYEVPIDTPPPPTSVPENMDYQVDIQQKPFSIKITRKSTGAVMFDSSVAPLIYADQVLQISTHLSTGKLYGLGEHKDSFLHQADQWSERSFWARDIPPTFKNNLYGDHPFYVEFEEKGNAHGVFLLNSNAMDIDIQPLPALTYRTIGGIIDISVFVGPSPDEVVQQYTSMIGRAIMPPYWALGFHLCRWGYITSENLMVVIKRNINAGMPYDTQWTDIDYMQDHLDWTYDTTLFDGLVQVTKFLHGRGMHYVPIVDPGISSVQPAGTYPPFDEGIKKDVFIKNATGQVLIGKVWPGLTAFPDFTNPATQEWWYEQANAFHQKIPFDGLWTDMNEPSNFVSGSTFGCPKDNKLDYPPFVPGIVGGFMSAATVCPSAQQHIGSHYDLHSMYGHFEVIASHKALEKIRGKRSLVISRSTFPSTGRYGGHWSGDVSSSWEDMRYSIPALLEFQMYGIPLMGADICGFQGDTQEEMCVRWMQLGAFYPFMRNHNTINRADQDPGSFDLPAQDIMRTALLRRYSLLPYLYSLFYATHITGRSHVARPLSFQYPTNTDTYGIDQQFFWGSTLLISPCLTNVTDIVHMYLPPEDIFYDFFTGARAPTSGWIDVVTPLEAINVHIRGGSIFVQQEPNVTTTRTRENPFQVTVALDANGKAESDVPLYWDDGETIDAYENNQVTSVSFSVQDDTLTSTPKVQYKPEGGMPLADFRLLGLKASPHSLTVNGKAAQFDYNDVTQELIAYIDADLTEPLTIAWK